MISFEDLLADLEASRRTIEQERAEIQAYRKETEELKAQAQQRRQKLEEQRGPDYTGGKRKSQRNPAGGKRSGR